jgi:hypothetical protein
VTRVYVDISVFTHTSSVGVVNGHMDLDVVPTEGGVVNFDRPRRPIAPLNLSGFTPSITVEHVLPPIPGGSEVALSLADITLATRADALKVVRYLERGFGLYFNEH